MNGSTRPCARCGTTLDPDGSCFMCEQPLAGEPPARDAGAAGSEMETVGEKYATGSRDRNGRVRLNIGNRPALVKYLREEIGRGALSGMFARGRTLVHTPRVGEDGYVPPKVDGADDGPAQVRPLGPDGLLAVLENSYSIGRVEQSKDGDTGEVVKKWRAALLPRHDVIPRMLGAVEVGLAPNLSQLRTITHTPTLTADGRIVDQPGYDKPSKILYLPQGDIGRVRVADKPTPDDVATAVELIKFPISKFPFVSECSRANWIGLALTPLLRGLVPPPYQFGIIEAPSPGSGKGFLLGVLNAVHGVAMRPGMPDRDDEWSKVIMTMLASTTAPILAFDNVRGIVHSAVLEGLLTTDTVSDRTLGKNTQILTLPNDRLWMMTGNNAQFGGDLSRRILRITIDPGVPNPEARRFDFNPVQWAKKNRADYIAALLTLIRHWMVSGGERLCEHPGRSDDYARWISVVRSILILAGIEGEFASRDPEKSELSADDEEWSALLEAIDAETSGHDFTAKDVAALVGEPGQMSAAAISTDRLPGPLAEKYNKTRGGGSFTISLGHWFKNREGRWVGLIKLEYCGKGTTGSHKNVQVYRIRRTGTKEEEPAAVGGREQ